MPEIEVKILNIDPPQLQHRLQALGAVCCKREFQRNYMYDYPDRRFYEQGDGSYVRLRVSRDRDSQHETTLLTVKKTLSRTGFKIAEETETPVLDFATMEQVLFALGLEQIRIDEKLRDSYQFQGVVIELDEWAGIPPYLEIEGPTTASIQQVLAPLGYTLSDTTSANLKEVMAMYQLTAKELRFADFGRSVILILNNFKQEITSMQVKWFTGLLMGVVIGFGVAGLQPLQAADPAPQMMERQMNALIKEVQELRKQAEKSNLNFDKVNVQLGKMATDLHNLAGRNDFPR